ncbi:MAG TPA: ABC transporter substrate-binding protein [Candidatus Lustribacter sp.]|nr:ABC transporter substrate-binding protein [Candidatus Lustribacter sp.]
MTGPSRSSFVRSAAAAGAGAAWAFPRVLGAQTAGSTPLHLASSPDDDVTPALYARSSGLFKNAGLTVTIDPLSNGTAVAAAIAGGAIDIGKASLLSIINAHLRGVPFVIIAPSGIADMGGSYAGMLVLKDSPIQSPRDLSGKTVAVPALHDIQSLATQALIDKSGGDSKTVSFVEEPGTAIGVALDTNRIASGVVANPALAQLMATGRYRSIGKPIEEGFNRDMVAAWITMADWATKNAGVVQRFGQAIATATAYCNAHPDKTIDLIAAFSNIDRSMLATMTRAKYAASLNPALVQPLVDAAARYGAIPKSYNAAELFSPAAYGYVKP